MKNPFHYYKVKTLGSSGQRIEFDDLKEFIRFAKKHNMTTIFLLMQENAQQPALFAFPYKGALLQQPAQGFKTLEDYLASVQNDFPDAPSYYDALAQGYSKFSDYKLVKETGINDKAVFMKMQEQGFSEGFADYKTLDKPEQGLPALGFFENPYQLYQHASAKGFSSYARFKEALLGGFTEESIFNAAAQKGYPTYSEYMDGLQSGFSDAAQLRKCRKLKLRNSDDANLYFDLEFLAKTGCAHDQRVLLELLSKLPDGKKVSINKIEELLQKQTEQYLYADTKEMPPWFTTAFTGKPSLIDFLLQSEHIKKYGQYDRDGEYFETHLLNKRKVVLDGSNVAYGNEHGKDAAPYVANILKVTDELSKKGFTELTIISDASLRHKLKDKDMLDKLKKTVEYIEAPAGTAADLFIIHYVKQHHCLLVSNDNFREWKYQDAWVAENIDYYRLSFIINGNTVLMPDLDKTKNVNMRGDGTRTQKEKF